MYLKSFTFFVLVGKYARGDATTGAINDLCISQLIEYISDHAKILRRRILPHPLPPCVKQKCTRLAELHTLSQLWQFVFSGRNFCWDCQEN